MLHEGRFACVCGWLSVPAMFTVTDDVHRGRDCWDTEDRRPPELLRCAFPLSMSAGKGSSIEISGGAIILDVVLILAQCFNSEIQRCVDGARRMRTPSNPRRQTFTSIQDLLYTASYMFILTRQVDVFFFYDYVISCSPPHWCFP